MAGKSNAKLPPATILEKSLAAVKWNYIGTVGRIASQLFAQITLARLLGPEAFGLFGVAFLVVGVGNIFVEIGLGSALIQKNEITDKHVCFVFTWMLIAGIGMAITVFFLADIIASFMGDIRSANVLRGLSPIFLIQALGVVPLSLLKRDMSFKIIQGVQIISYVCGFLVVGVVAALLGAGVWSLVVAVIVQSALASLMLYLKKRPTLGLQFTENGVGLRSFGVRVLLTNISNWIIENVDNLLVGKLFGPTSLGLYSVSYNLVRTPANHLVVTLQTVLFPASARAQDNLDSLRRAYLAVASGVSLIAFPVFAGCACVSGTVVTALYGQDWLDAAPILTPLALSMILHAVMAVSGPVLWGKGAAGAELKVQFWVALIFVAFLLFASQFSLTAMAWAVCLVYALRLAGMTAAVIRHIRLPILSLMTALRGGVLAALLVVSMLLTVDTALPATAVTLKLTLEVFLAGVVLILFVISAPKLALSEGLSWMMYRLLVNSPRFGRSFLLRRLSLSHEASSLRSTL
ncbi:lipopolysaccharide biosynthesis protein [Geobacter sp.]|uniref:lipopolysaccharide biosynthesis protein n=1 Tax=Geobacter sp. TaxID=46610 RepID=UPI002637AD36|nr:lipopolysaccharide biosynthesis protein [Geobacter sp.]